VQPGPDDHQLSREVAVAAGRMLLDLRAKSAHGGPALGALGDRQAHRLIVDRLTAARPDDAVLSEEGPDDPARLDARRVWIVDPLDGTREFSESRRADWAVHVALWEDGDLRAGTVAMPARDATYSTAEPPRLPSPRDGALRIAVSRTRAPRLARHLAAELGAHLVHMGSAGAKAMAVVSGEVDAYVHAGGQYEWDSAAPVAVARSAGLHASRLDGAPLLYNCAGAWLPDLLICRPEVAGELLDLLALAG
jgi:3'(2'), 5'-bisphosphate nucleotidase